MGFFGRLLADTVYNPLPPGRSSAVAADFSLRSGGVNGEYLRLGKINKEEERFSYQSKGGQAYAKQFIL
jgi:hypothetical protein